MPTERRTKSTQTNLLKWQRNLSAFVREFRFERQLDRSQFRELTGFSEMNVKSLESRTEVSSWVRAIFKLINLSEVCDKEISQIISRITGTRSRATSSNAAKDHNLIKDRVINLLDQTGPELCQRILNQIEDSSFISDETWPLIQAFSELKEHQSDAVIKLLDAFKEDNRRNLE